MTVTVKEFIAALKKLPQDAVVRCLEEKRVYYQTRAEWKNLSLGDIYAWGKENATTFVDIGDK